MLLEMPIIPLNHLHVGPAATRWQKSTDGRLAAVSRAFDEAPTRRLFFGGGFDDR
jgi:hypothetical protein